jgi:hypothetical protein
LFIKTKKKNYVAKQQAGESTYDGRETTQVTSSELGHVVRFGAELESKQVKDALSLAAQHSTVLSATAQQVNDSVSLLNAFYTRTPKSGSSRDEDIYPSH